MLKIDNSQSSLTTKGYVHRSLYTHIENDFLLNITKLRKRHYTFSSIPLCKLNELKMKKDEAITSLKELSEVMAENYHPKTYVLPVRELNNEGITYQLKIANELLPGVTLPLVASTKNWIPKELLPKGACLSSYVNCLKDTDSVKNKENNLFEEWVTKGVKKHCTDSFFDKTYRLIFTKFAERKARKLNLTEVSPQNIIQNAINRHLKNQENKAFEKNFMDSMKF